MYSLPKDLEDAIESCLPKTRKDVFRGSEILRKCYRYEKTGHLFQDTIRLAYLASRFVPTYMVARFVLHHVKTQLSSVESILDVGSGPGSMAQAFIAEGMTQPMTCFEQDKGFIQLGKTLPRGRFMTWHLGDIRKDLAALKAHDLVSASYVLGEIKDSDLEHTLDTLWQKANQAIIVTLPGTPHDFQKLMKIREFFISRKGRIVAPCPHQGECPLANGKDWCHFSLRLKRPRFLQDAKKGSIGYEDEKFCYLVMVKDPAVEKPFPRVVKKPIKGSGHILFDLCTESGLKRTIVTKKNKPQYLMAKKINWGSTFTLNKDEENHE